MLWGRRQWWDDDGKQEARERCATHPSQQSTHADSWGGGERQERGTIVGVRMTEKGRGGGDLVETFELQEITSLPFFPCTQEQQKDRNLFRMRPWCPAALSAPWSARVPGQIGGMIDWGNCCNFNIIFNVVVGPICGRNLHRQPLSFDASRPDALMIELDFLYMYFPWLRSFEKPYV